MTRQDTTPAAPLHGLDRVIQEQAAYYGRTVAEQGQAEQILADMQERAETMQWEARP